MQIAQKQMVGSVDFICELTGRRMTTVPLYKGESIQGHEVLFRAQLHLKLESTPVGHLGSNPYQEHHAYNAKRKLVTYY